jgi:hypothetical protein
MNVNEKKAVTELLGCIQVIAKRYANTVPGAMADICLSEVLKHLGCDEITQLSIGPHQIEYARLEDLLDELSPIDLKLRRTRGMDTAPRA